MNMLMFNYFLKILYLLLLFFKLYSIPGTDKTWQCRTDKCKEWNLGES